MFDPLDRYLAVGCRDKSFTVFDTSTWFPIKHIHTPGWVTCISWGAVSAVRDVVAVRGQHSCISIYDFTPIHIQTPSGRLHQPTFTPSKSSRVGGGGGNVEALSSLSWSRDGRFLARINGSRVILTDSHAGFEDVSYFKLHGTLRCVAFCPALERQDLLAVVGLNGYLSLLRYEVDEESNQVQLEIMQSMFVEDDLWVVAWIHGEFQSICTCSQTAIGVTALTQGLYRTKQMGRCWLRGGRGRSFTLTNTKVKSLS